MKLLLMNPPNLEDDTILATQPYSLGLLILYNVAREHGYKVDLINCRDKNQMKEIMFSQYTLIGIPCYSRQRYSVFQTVNYIKLVAPNTLVFIGGPHVLGIEEKILRHYPNCDFVISKEGELSLLYLLKAITNNYRSFENIPNLTWRCNDVIIKNEILYNLQLDQIPYPYYHLEYFQDYSRFSRGGMYFKNPGLVGAVSLSRGCNNSCIFCANQSCFGKQRFFSLNYIKGLLKLLYEHHQIRTIHFVDDDFCGNRKRVLDICDYIISNKMDIQWRCSTRATNIDVELAQVMIEAGCKMISIGLESGSQKVLDSIGKNYCIAEVMKELCLIKKLNIELRISLTFGYETEDNEAYDETVNLINTLKPNAVAFFFLKVYPGTPLYKQAVSENYISDEFWFNDEHSVPYFERYKSFYEFNNIVKPYMLEHIKADFPRTYNEGRDDSEYYFIWKD